MADKAIKGEKAGMSNTWVIGVVLIILVLGGAGLYQMKLKNNLQAKLDKKEKQNGYDSTDKTSLGGDESEDKGSGSAQALS